MPNNRNKIVAIIGPTAVGKTKLAMELSSFGEFEVISADSRQIYRYLDIGTAKPNMEEQNNLKHHCIDFLTPSDYYSAGNFANDAKKAYNEIINNGKYPLLVGGSGLYIKAMIEGFSLVENSLNSNATNSKQIRNDLEKVLNQYGKDFLYDELKKVDPKAAEIYPDKNPRRIIRAMEYYYSTGKLFSETFDDNKAYDFKPYYIGLNNNREILYKIINERVDKMWELGLVEETRKVLEMGYSKDLNSLNTVGYKETISYLDSLITKDQAIELIKRNSRRYAKRQITWFKAIKDVNWYRYNELNVKKIAEEIKRFYQF